MGQAGSIPSSKEENNSTSSEAKDFVSGVSISSELEADIVRDFSNQAVQEQWTQFRIGVLNRREKIAREMAQQEAHRLREHQALALQTSQRLASLDTAIDQMNASFADTAIALEYDVAALSKEFEFLPITPTPTALPTKGDEVSVVGVDTDANAKDENDKTTKYKAIPCFKPRVHWLDCIQKYQGSNNIHDMRQCDIYLEALEICVNKTIVQLSHKTTTRGSPSKSESESQ